MNSQTFIQTINNERKANKNNWYSGIYQVNEKEVRVKGFGTWLQVYTVDGIDYAGAMDTKVSQFLATLARPFY